MKKIVEPLILFTLCTVMYSTNAQTLSYYLPKKKLKLTVTYTVVGQYKKTRNPTGRDSVLSYEHQVFIEDDVLLETVVVPDPDRFFQLSLPRRLNASSTFEWSFAFDKKGMGIFNSLNAARTSAASALIAGSVGLVTNIVTGVTGLRTGRLPAAADPSYVQVQEQKIVVSEVVDIPAEGLLNFVLTGPLLNFEGTIPKVIISATTEGDEPALESDDTRETSKLYSIIPRWYRVNVTVEDNGYLARGKIIDISVPFPQHGVLTSVTHNDLFKGSRSLSVTLDPDNGQLQIFEYKKRGGAEVEWDSINRRLSDLVIAVSELRNEHEDRLSREVKKLELETERLELLQKQRMLESVEGQ